MIKSFGLLILRISIGTMLIHHGYEKTADIQNFADAFVRPIGLPFPILSSYIAAYSEIYGSWLLIVGLLTSCLLYTSPSPRDLSTSRMPSSA